MVVCAPWYQYSVVSHAELLRCRVALPSSPDDTVLAAVSIKGTALLAWIQHVLSAAPFFAQTSQVSIARRSTVRRHDPSIRLHPCALRLDSA